MQSGSKISPKNSLKRSNNRAPYSPSEEEFSDDLGLDSRVGPEHLKHIPSNQYSRARPHKSVEDTPPLRKSKDKAKGSK